MERIVKTKFWDKRQNNSGGYFVYDETRGVGVTLIIEAFDAKDAARRLESIGDCVSGFWGYCECCGERWSTWFDEDGGTDEPTIWGEPLSNSTIRDSAYIHYIDGTFKHVGEVYRISNLKLN